MWVEAWAPEYGSSFELDGFDPASEEPAGEPVEDVAWSAVAPGAQPLPPVAFLDGVSRVDARVVMDAGAGAPVAGLCGSVGVGAMLHSGAMRFGETSVHRAVVFGQGARVDLPAVSAVLRYAAHSAPGATPEIIRRELERFREANEAALALQLANQGWVVIADGRMRQVEPVRVVGYIKSHNARYLGPQLESLVPALRPGERTPMFHIPRAHTYSWYLCLSAVPGAAPWAGIARCEVSASLAIAEARGLADLTAWHLPRYASEEFWDTRSPQNLVPIATLERRLWHLLGDRQLVLRRIRSAVARQRDAEDSPIPAESALPGPAFAGESAVPAGERRAPAPAPPTPAFAGESAVPAGERRPPSSAPAAPGPAAEQAHPAASGESSVPAFAGEAVRA